jgi:uncharacterized membrane protein
MAASWERYLERWTKAGLIETSVADRVRTYETEQERAHGLKWPVVLAISLGGLLLAAGILLFVAAHWDTLSPALRFAMVLALVAVMHVAGAISATRFNVLSTTLHAVGTICLGAGIFLTGQIFNMQEHWPSGVMLWALGAWVALALLRDWPQAGLAAVLTPAWVAGEWLEATQGMTNNNTMLAAGLLLLSVTYLSAVLPGKATPVRKVLLWIGGIFLIPLTAFVIQSGSFGYWGRIPLPLKYYLFGWTAALISPLLLAWWFRGQRVWLNVIAVFWVIALSITSLRSRIDIVSHNSAHDMALYAICALGAIGLIAWGMKEARKERVNLGIAGFALTVLFFYFSNIMDKLGRSACLIGLGVLFLLGGWLLEKARRRLLAGMNGGVL